jgi:hypothetical protein
LSESGGTVKEEAAEEGGVGSTHATEGSAGSGAEEAEGDINGVEDEDGDTTDTDSLIFEILIGPGALPVTPRVMPLNLPFDITLVCCC